MAKPALIESVMPQEELDSMNNCDNEDNCSLDENFNTSFTSSTITGDFQDAESILQASDNIQPGANSTMSGFDDNMLPSSV